LAQVQQTSFRSYVGRRDAPEPQPPLCVPSVSVRVACALFARARSAASVASSAGLLAVILQRCNRGANTPAKTGPELAGAAPRGDAEPARAVEGLLPEFLTRATQQGAAALSGGRAGDAVKFCTEALELARAYAGATPEVVSGVLAQRSEAQLAAGDPERAMADGLAALQQSVTNEVRVCRSVSCAARGETREDVSG